MVNDKIVKISNELKRSGIGSNYLVSVLGNKKMYTISSESLKNSLRKIIFDSHLLKDAFGGMKIEGRSFQSTYFSYQEGINSPDEFMVISDWEERLEEIVEDSKQKEKETNERMKNERRQVNRPVEENNSPFDSWNKDAVRFRRWDTQGNLVEERVKLLDKSVFFPEELEKDNSSKIMEIDDKGNVINQSQEDADKDNKKQSRGNFSTITDEQRKKDEMKVDQWKQGVVSDATKEQLKKDKSQESNGVKKFAKFSLFGGAFFFIVGCVVMVLKP